MYVSLVFVLAVTNVYLNDDIVRESGTEVLSKTVIRLSSPCKVFSTHTMLMLPTENVSK